MVVPDGRACTYMRGDLVQGRCKVVVLACDDDEVDIVLILVRDREVIPMPVDGAPVLPVAGHTVW